MTPKHALFVAEYLKDLNATQAAIRSGYSKKTARQQASDLLTNPAIETAIQAGLAKRLQKAELTADRVLEEMRRLAFADIRRLFDEHGDLKPLHTLSAEDAAAIASIEVVKKNLAAGDNHVDIIHKVKAWDKTKALDMLGKHFNLLTEQVRHTGDLTISWQAPTS